MTSHISSACSAIGLVHILVATTLATGFACLAPAPVRADDFTAAEDEATAAYNEIRENYGYMPGFFQLFPRDRAGPLWNAFVTLEIDPAISTPAATRELISVAVAAQGTCRSCVYFHAAAAYANGATEAAIREAIGIGAATRRLDSDLEKADVDFERFKHETDFVLWYDAATIERRGPPSDFCAFISAWAGSGHVGCN